MGDGTASPFHLPQPSYLRSSSISILVLSLGRLLQFLKAQVDKDIVLQEKGTDSSAKSTSHLTTRPNGPSYVPPMIPMDNDDGIPYKGLVKTYIERRLHCYQYKKYCWIETLT